MKNSKRYSIEKARYKIKIKISSEWNNNLQKRMTSSVPLVSLTQSKRSQLHQSANDQPFYIHIQSYQTDKTIGVTFYLLEFGIKKNDLVQVHPINVRFSQLDKLDKLIRQNFINSSVLNKFPPKKYFFNKDKTFLKKRSEDLQNYLSSLTKLPKLLEFNEFRKFFNLD